VDVYLEAEELEKNTWHPAPRRPNPRLYKRRRSDVQADDAGGARWNSFGEDKIDHTPKDETLLVRMGSAFDITGERRKPTSNSKRADGHRKRRGQAPQSQEGRCTSSVKETLYAGASGRFTAAR